MVVLAMRAEGFNAGVIASPKDSVDGDEPYVLVSGHALDRRYCVQISAKLVRHPTAWDVELTGDRQQGEREEACFRRVAGALKQRLRNGAL